MALSLHSLGLSFERISYLVEAAICNQFINEKELFPSATAVTESSYNKRFSLSLYSIGRPVQETQDISQCHPVLHPKWGLFRHLREVGIQGIRAFAYLKLALQPLALEKIHSSLQWRKEGPKVLYFTLR